MANNPDDKGSYSDLKKSVEEVGKPIGEILDAIGSMYDEADKLNNAFVQGRTRLDEMNDAVSRAAAGVIRLGGDVSNVSATMMGIADGARRNVIATEDQVSKLYAASTILGTSSKELVENFAEVGIEVSQIGPNIESSIEYIQSVGLNAKTVMTDVTRNMELMNRFNFNDGVQGLTKMAAQASMLRFDMSQTANFADKVISPEGAINMAASFQRLGLAVGNLVDPFALMNDSINDPGALQDSLIKATKQFTEFDEKTKTFKINPQGILTLREMANETGISYDQLTKTALAAADLDNRLAAISPSLQFENEEDKQFIANMATMSKEGDYVVKLKNDETGIIETKKLGELTQEEMVKLREQQENAPKTLEDIQTSQLDVMKNIEALVRGTVAKGTYGVAGTSVIRGNLVGAERITRSLASAVDTSIPGSAKITDKLNSAIMEMKDLYVSKDSGKISNADFTKKLESIEEGIEKEAKKLGSGGIKTLTDILQKTSEGITGTSGIEKEFKKYTSEILTSVGRTSESKTKVSEAAKAEKMEPISRESYFGSEKSIKADTSSVSKSKSVNSQIDFGGTITVKVEAPAGVSEQQFKTYFESEEFKKMIYKYYEDKAKELQK
jgi:hypothetical protein